jgi:hypothetical protein
MEWHEPRTQPMSAAELCGLRRHLQQVDKVRVPHPINPGPNPPDSLLECFGKLLHIIKLLKILDGGHNIVNLTLSQKRRHVFDKLSSHLLQTHRIVYRLHRESRSVLTGNLNPGLTSEEGKLTYQR